MAFPGALIRRARHTIGSKRRSSAPSPVRLEEIAEALQAVGVRPGRDILVHTSSKAFYYGGQKANRAAYGSILDYSNAILDLLLELIAPDGTLVVPTDSISAVQGFVYRGDVFDWRSAPSRRGLITELARNRPGAVRSVHPWYNVTALGPDAAELVHEHEQSRPYTMDEHSPWFKLMQRDGLAVFFGVPFAVNSYIHLPEYLHPAEYPRPVFFDKPHVFRYVDRAGEVREMPVLLHAIRWDDEDVNSFCRHLDAKYGIYRHHDAGAAEIVGFTIRDQYDALMRERDANVCWYDVRFWPERP